MMKTKLNELLEFPCSFTYKVMGHAKPELVDQVVEVIQRHAPGDYTPSVKPSKERQLPFSFYYDQCNPYRSSRNTV